MGNQISIDRLVSFVAMSLSGCKDEQAQGRVNCTEEFRSTTLFVPGALLTESFTIRLSNSDTIRINANSDFRQGYYVVLDDKYKTKLKNQQDSFRFMGKRGNQVVVQENYVFKADQCHITKVSGKTSL
ncbi:hypothetical protein SAMN05216327_106384 [Dyadobacter sp. SG02]|uniref:hypothetical protein n=1 Tax=Dyadobacter sp. SG02 TaxID=1855291 RepID=UPI0008B7D91D|nr:hypothetical protein [Dyadobacter sp. SG02]SEJ15685.1 hypothetical protein SAMN05216327_106384 [Dyadobacter sp. SG02]